MLYGLRGCVKRLIGTSPFQLVYGKEAVIPIQLRLSVPKLVQHEEDEQNDMLRRLYELIKLQQKKEKVSVKNKEH